MTGPTMWRPSLQAVSYCTHTLCPRNLAATAPHFGRCYPLRLSNSFLQRQAFTVLVVQQPQASVPSQHGSKLHGAPWSMEQGNTLSRQLRVSRALAVGSSTEAAQTLGVEWMGIQLDDSIGKRGSSQYLLGKTQEELAIALGEQKYRGKQMRQLIHKNKAKSIHEFAQCILHPPCFVAYATHPMFPGFSWEGEMRSQDSHNFYFGGMLEERHAIDFMEYFAAQKQFHSTLPFLSASACYDVPNEVVESRKVPKQFRMNLETSRDGTAKLFLRLEDNRLVETVGIPDKDRERASRLTACLSSQVGCALWCTFCATGKGGSARNLKASEIIDQVIAIEETFKHWVTNVVIMGMGEPLMNLSTVPPAHRPLSKELLIGQRMMTNSTFGVPNTIAHIATHKLQSTRAIRCLEVASWKRAPWVDSLLYKVHRRSWVLRTMSTCSQRDCTIAYSSGDLRATNMVQTAALIHATSGKVKFLGMYVGVITDPKGKRQGLKALEKRRRVIHRLRMLQKQRKESWEKEVGRIALQSFTRGYRKVLNTLKSGSKAKQAIFDKATELGMKAALDLSDRQPLISSDDLKKLLEEEEDHFSRLGWDYLPISVKVAYENLLLTIDEACADLKAKAGIVKHLSEEHSDAFNQQAFSSAENVSDMTSGIGITSEGDVINSIRETEWLQSAVDTSDRTPQPQLDYCGDDIFDYVSDPHSLQAAYDRLNSKHRITLMKHDEWGGHDWNWFKHTSYLLRSGTYEFTPVSRVSVSKPGKEVVARTITLVTVRDQLVAEALKVELQRLYEPTFLEDSHGFRLNKSCHTALKTIKNGWKDIAWFIQFPSEKSFDWSHCEKLISILSERIHDLRTLGLLKQMLMVGIISLGCPVGDCRTPLSALLCNIYYHQLDAEMAKIKIEYKMGLKKRNMSTMFRSSTHLDGRATAMDDPELVRQEQQLQPLGAHIPHSQGSEYVRVRYIRYAEDFLIGISGSKTVALAVLNRVKDFLRDELKLQVFE